MTVKGPQVKDFTGDPERFPVEVVADPVFELLLSLFTYSSMAHSSPKEFALGGEWFDGVRARASAELRDVLDGLEDAGEIWIELIGTALSLPAPRSVAALVAHLRATDPIEQRLQYIVKGCMHCRHDVDGAVQQRAAEGDTDAIEELSALSACKMSDGLRGLLDVDPDATIELLASTIEWFDRDIFHGGGDISDVLNRDAEHKRAMARTMKAPRLVETATNGITFEFQPEVDAIVLIPSVVIRPWVTIGGRDRRRIFCYPVAEEHLTADPESPPTHLVEVYKALGDERRLRLLRILAEGSKSLADVTESIGLAKSTVHHHLSILRQAGLVLITIGADKEYSLRHDAIPEAADLLAGFLDNS